MLSWIVVLIRYAECLQSDRYKIIVHVILGDQKGEGVRYVVYDVFSVFEMLEK